MGLVQAMEGSTVIISKITMTIRRLSIMRHLSTIQLLQIFRHFPLTYTDHQLTSQRTLPRRATLQHVWCTQTTSFYCQKHFVTSHTFLIIFETPCAISIFVTNLNTYTVPILFFYIKKRL